MKLRGFPDASAFSHDPSALKGYPVYLCNTDCYAVVTIDILEAHLARAHVVFVHFAGIEGSIDSYGRHILTISKQPE